MPDERDPKVSPPKINWNDSNMHSSYANVCNVSFTRDEVTLVFGMNKLWQGGQSVSWVYLVALAFVSLVMTVQGYLGGELVYRYGVEVEQAYRELPDHDAESPTPQLVSSKSASTSARTKKQGEAA